MAKDAFEVGDKMPDGTIYAGISPSTGKKMFAAPADSSLKMNFDAAAKYAENLQVGDKKDFRIPTKEELNVLFQNRDKGALKGTFNLAGVMPPIGWYVSSTLHNPTLVWVQRFRDGIQQSTHFRGATASVRCVR